MHKQALPEGALSLTHLVVVEKVSQKRGHGARTPQGDRKGPHSSPHRPRPYHDYDLVSPSPSMSVTDYTLMTKPTQVVALPQISLKRRVISAL